MTSRSLAAAFALGLAALVAMPAASQAATYRCQLPPGASEYRDTPCPQGAQHVLADVARRCDLGIRDDNGLRHRASALARASGSPDIAAVVALAQQVRSGRAKPPST